MRLPTSHAATTLLLLPPVASTIQYFPRPPASGDQWLKQSLSRSLAQGQHRTHRDVTTNCVSINGQTFAANVGIPAPSLYVSVLVCTCSGEVDNWLDTNPNGIQLASMITREAAKTYLVGMLNNYNPADNPFPRSCTLPAHGTRTCVIDSPCDFICMPNYTLDVGQCICAGPNTVCNGECGAFPDGCDASSVLRKRRGIPVTALAQAKLACKLTESVCGVPGRENGLDFECVDTSTASNSCGGCITPHPFHEPYRAVKIGRKCGRLPGAISVRCEQSQCVVYRCRHGQEPSTDRSFCVKISFDLKEQFVIDGAQTG